MSRKEVLDLAYKNLCHVFISYAHDNGIDDKEKKRILDLFSEAYTNKKAEIFLSERLIPYTKYLNDAFATAFSMADRKAHPNQTKGLEVLYLKHLRKEEEVYE
ncbi:MAG: hypothetical protein LKE54_01895 [Prevotella sp.]|nr:hypothetical protein [Prevotella sp.]MCH3993808.1 hypothetical protein [Prevotella sp.]